MRLCLFVLAKHGENRAGNIWNSKVLQMLAVAWLLLLLPAVVMRGQTRIDLQKQARNVDFSEATSTRTTKTGAILPATCQVGETFFLTVVAPGENLYGCTATNVWNPLADGGGSGNLAGMGLILVGNEFSVDDATIPTYLTGNGAPAISCRSGAANYLDVVSGSWYYCNDTSTWTKVVSAGAATMFDAGATQQFRANTNTAGMRVVCGPLPASPENGDIVCDQADGAFKVRTVGAWVTITGSGAQSGGSASANIFIVGSSQTMDGTDKTLISAVLPASSLGAGECAVLELGFQRNVVGTGSYTVKVKFGNDTRPLLSSSTNNSTHYYNLRYCNKPGVTNDQIFYNLGGLRVDGVAVGQLWPAQTGVDISSDSNATQAITISLLGNAAADNALTAVYWNIRK